MSVDEPGATSSSLMAFSASSLGRVQRVKPMSMSRRGMFGTNRFTAGPISACSCARSAGPCRRRLHTSASAGRCLRCRPRQGQAASTGAPTGAAGHLHQRHLPGIVETDMLQSFSEHAAIAGPSFEQILANGKALVPLRRILAPQEIAHLTVCLARPRATAGPASPSCWTAACSWHDPAQPALRAGAWRIRHRAGPT